MGLLSFSKLLTGVNTRCSANHMKFEKFASKHLGVYREWFQDPLLAQHLGPEVTDDWLEFVLTDESGRQFAVMDQSQLVAVVGVVFPTNEVPDYVISDIAVNPKLRSMGVGRRVVERLLREFELKEYEQWKAFVAQDNQGAFAFFQSLGWVLRSNTADSDDMFVFTNIPD